MDKALIVYLPKVIDSTMELTLILPLGADFDIVQLDLPTHSFASLSLWEGNEEPAEEAGQGDVPAILGRDRRMFGVQDAAIRVPVLRVEVSLGYLRRFKLRQRSRGHWNVGYGRTAGGKGEQRRGERPGQRYRPSSVPCSQKLTGSGADVMGFDMPQVQAITGISPSSSRFMCSLSSTQPHFQPEQPRSAAAMMWCLQVIIYLACTTTPCRRPWPKAFHIG